jgi:serine/threonine protein kinase
MGVRHVVFAAGEEFAGYTIESVLGTGGMGAVYLAKHPRLPRRDALKLLNPAFSGDPNFRTRFEREADLASGLIHRNIVAVYDRGAVDGQLWISMQYVAGVDASVASRAGDGSMTPHRVVHIISEVGAGLDFAHRSGLLHRDVKPANILLAAPDDPGEPEHVLLTDFGIAKSTDEVQHLTGTGNLLATLAYASPEQIEAKPLDHRVDIYALGCVLYELLTGSVPYPEASPFATMTAHLKNPPPKPSDKVPWLPPGFDAVVAKAMAKDPADRYNSCRELSLAARAALASADPSASTPTRAETAVPPTVAPVGEREHTAMEAAVPEPGAKGADDPIEAVSLTTPRPPYTVSVRRTSEASGTVSELGPVSTNYLGATNRIALEELLHRSRFFDLPPRLPLVEVVPGDVLQEITVGNNDVTRTVVYERDGARRPKELDEIVSLLERLAGWQTIRQSTALPRPGGPAPWTPTGTVPPLGAASVRSTEAYPPPVGVGARPTGPVGGGFYPPGPTGSTGPTGLPMGGPPGAPGGPPPGGNYQSGPHTGYSQQFAAVQHTGPATAVTGSSSGSKKWILIGLVAVLVILGGATAGYFLTRDNTPVVSAPATPTGLTATADGRDITVTWSGTTGATGYTLRRSGDTVYAGVATKFAETNVLPGKYDYTVTATNAAGLESGPTVPVYVTVTGPWGPVTALVDEFPELLPATPAATGYDSASCSIGSDLDSSNADGIIVCNDPNGVYFEVDHFASEADKDAYLDRDWSGAPVIESWNVDGVDQGKLYRSADDEATQPYIITTFTDPARAQYLLYVHWKDHTMTDLMDKWWKPADF